MEALTRDLHTGYWPGPSTHQSTDQPTHYPTHQPTASDSPTHSIDSNIPRLLKVLLGIGAERRQGLRALESRHRGEDLRHHVRDLVVLGHLDDGHQIPVTTDGVNVRHSLDLGEALRGGGERGRLGANEHDGRDHGGKGEGDGGTFSIHNPAIRRLSGSTSSRRSRANRTVRTGRGLPSRKWITRCVSSASASSRVSTSTADTSGVSPGDGTTTRASSAAGGASPRRLWTSGQTATSTPSMQPDATSRISQEPSDPSSSTDPDIPARPFAPRSRAVRMSVSASHRYSTAGTPTDGSSCTATVTILLRSAIGRR